MTENALIIESIKKGQTERFGELIDRYTRMVYGIAWSYLGDADACEDVAQETFLKGFQLLGSLRDPGKFGPWIARIARNAAITFGRRRRRELATEERWQIQSTVADESPDAENDPSLVETISGTLRQLAPEHREALVLFYLEGKSIRESSEILGLTENAFKTRLYRARSKMRERMDEHLERSLRDLAPRDDLRSRVLAAIPAAPLGWGGVGGAVSSFAPGLVPILLALVSKMPFLFLLSYANRGLAHNFRDENDFRRRVLWKNFTLLLVVLIPILILASPLCLRIGFRTYSLILAVYMIPAVIQFLLLLRVNQSRYTVVQGLGCTSMLVTFLLMGVFSFPFLTFVAVMLVLNIALWFVRKEMPQRMDYNLFLRASRHGLGTTRTSRMAVSLSGADLWVFARFLGKHFLILDCSVDESGCRLYCPAVASDFLRAFLMPIARWNGSSTISVSRNGECRVHLSRRDARQIAAVTKNQCPAVEEIEKSVRLAIAKALGAFMAGDQSKALSVLQSESDECIFVRPPHQLRSQKVVYLVAIVAGIFLLLALIMLRGIRLFP